MKRNLLLGVTATVVMGLCGLQAMAQEGAPRREKAEGRPAGKAGDPDVLVSRLTETLQLTAEQAGKLKQVLQTFRQANENWVKEHAQELKAAQEKLASARQDRKPEEMKAAREAMEKIQATRKDLLENVKKQLAEVPLTPEMIEKVLGALAPRGHDAPRPAARILEALRGLGLSQEQREKVRAILEPAQADAGKGQGRQAKVEALKAAFEKIKTDVLTEEQRKKLAETAKAGAQAGEDLPPMLAGLKLSDEQRTKARALWSEALKNVGADQNKRAVLRETVKKIADEVLTPEQREQLKKRMEGAAPAAKPAPGAAAGN